MIYSTFLAVLLSAVVGYGVGCAFDDAWLGTVIGLMFLAMCFLPIEENK